jgi:hypothetical protein
MVRMKCKCISKFYVLGMDLVKVCARCGRVFFRAEYPANLWSIEELRHVIWFAEREIKRWERRKARK